ncbi:hypothetical protein ERICIV_00947 [Paenibacillus larvae subsp. larvae]|uniref:Uncharacterized protein n=1 Tax=Paenibacillus larvae subsp. larvae TaxID=147375 RepID=A0A2L1UAE4_9BACL|nr:hypothetical protein [Paenibacillus larvae]AQT85735.1 hypothetical protein B1222_17080 [Paenibacillus larvae subsp. pulvifaciens]AQZ47697.1 hypothetical protein B5S25_15065 [Paenibacillus larvae subsp. pulvifaciens]AVF25132.1 hypothetical protein ERICIII_00927 [Paenibacillus larvae subsp. larvae]AVF29910.1 hypothetical protein ERICIV_00947 [Paenibacillus larvae subsp. larvae]MBH0344484.1 hypothetical protein [Paenibacillus larvae]
MKKFLVFLSLLALVITIVLPSSSMAATNDRLARFEQHLYSLDKSDPFVSEQIEKYSKLTEKQKQRVVEILYEPNIIQQAFDTMQTLDAGNLFPCQMKK